MICELLGLPTSDADRLVPHVLGVGELLDGLADEDGMTRAGLAADGAGRLRRATLTSSSDRGLRATGPR